MLRRFGLKPKRSLQFRETDRARLPGKYTRLVAAEVFSKYSEVTLPVRLDPAFRWETTHLLNQLVVLWGEVPIPFLLQFNPRQHLYGYIGASDRTMYPLLRPGSLVMIDDNRRRVQRGGWSSEFERPIYFLEFHDGYRCGWCHLKGSHLTLLPHPNSGLPAETFNHPEEVEVVGQVVGVAMRLVPPGTTGQVTAPGPAALPAAER